MVFIFLVDLSCFSRGHMFSFLRNIMFASEKHLMSINAMCFAFGAVVCEV
jgi:hypothetical protein